jgi:acetyltransferase
MHMVDYRRNQNLLMETPASIPEVFAPDNAAARAVIDHTLKSGRPWLSEAQAKSVLAAYQIPTVATRIAGTPDEAARHAAEVGGAVALKILSPDITHKSDVGGVVLNLAAP